MPEPIPTPNIPSGGLFSATASGTINASAETIYKAHADPRTWPEWNSFVPSMEIKSHAEGVDSSSPLLHLGTTMLFAVQMSPSFKTKSTEQISILSDPPKDSDPVGTKYSIGWKQTMMPGFVLRTERVNEITKLDGGKCEYKTWMVFGGPAAYAVRWAQEANLQARFEDWVKDLKEWSEKHEGKGEATSAEA
ncbi:Hypothetical protein D9617_3g021150 [Elsinoe fawcettii]|nr:Hypothetical protein D9617_3g021150 [Elsinoe fawcettii]